MRIIEQTVISIREEQPGDVAAIRDLNRLAFVGPVEAAIVPDEEAMVGVRGVARYRSEFKEAMRPLGNRV